METHHKITSITINHLNASQTSFNHFLLILKLRPLFKSVSTRAMVQSSRVR